MGLTGMILYAASRSSLASSVPFPKLSYNGCHVIQSWVGRAAQMRRDEVVYAPAHWSGQIGYQLPSAGLVGFGDDPHRAAMHILNCGLLAREHPLAGHLTMEIL